MNHPQTHSPWACLTLATVCAATLLGGCGATTTVIGRSGGVSNVRPGAALTMPARPAVAAKPQVLVKFKAKLETAALAGFRTSFGLRNVGMIAALGVYVEEVTVDRAIGDVLRELNASPLVEYAEYNQEVHLDP